MTEAGGKRHAADEEAVRRLIASWTAEPAAPGSSAEPGSSGDPEAGEADLSASSLPLGTGLDVPPAAAAEVIAAARRIATEGLGAGPQPEPEPEPALRLLAEAMVLDEHPSVGDWSPADRALALDWITLLVHRFGEDGVQRLITALS